MLMVEQDWTIVIMFGVMNANAASGRHFLSFSYFNSNARVTVQVSSTTRITAICFRALRKLVRVIFT